MAVLDKTRTVYDILNDPAEDRDLKTGLLEALRPIHEQFQNLKSTPDWNSTSMFRACREANHCPAMSAKDMSVFGGTVAPAFNIYGPSGKQSLASYRFNSHTGRIGFEGIKASGQFSIDVFKSGAKHVVLKNIREVLKDKAKDEIKTLLFNPKNYAHVSFSFTNPNSKRLFKEKALVHVGTKFNFKLPDHEDVIVNIRVDPTRPILWRMTVEAADYIKKR